MGEHGQPHGQERGGQDDRLTGERLLLEEEQREDDRRRAARPEPAEERDGGASGSAPEHRDRDRDHPDEGEAQSRVQGDLPREVAQRRAEQHGAEDDEGHGREDGAGLLDEMGDVPAPPAPKAAEDRAADERRDEPRALDGLREPEREQRSGERHDLEPRLVDESTATCPHDDGSGRGTGDHAAEDAVADLLGDELRGVAVADRTVLRERDCERDEEERHADAVVQSALDVEALPDADGQPRRRHDRLPEGGVGGGEDDGEDERLGPREVTQQDERREEAGADRERQADAREGVRGSRASS